MFQTVNYINKYFITLCIYYVNQGKHEFDDCKDCIVYNWSNLETIKLKTI